MNDEKPLASVVRVKVVTLEPLTGYVHRVLLEGDAPFDYEAGQYLNLYLEGKAYPFSIANAPAGNQLELHIRSLPGHESAQWIIDYLKAHDEVEVEVGLGDVTLDCASPDQELVLIGTSTGFSQLKAIIEAAFRREPNRRIHLYWANGCQADVYLPAIPKAWQSQHPNFHYHPLLNDELDDWEGRTGWLHEALLEDFANFSDVALFACGSPSMVYSTLEALEAKGHQLPQVFSDVFAYAPRSA